MTLYVIPSEAEGSLNSFEMESRIRERFLHALRLVGMTNNYDF